MKKCYVCGTGTSTTKRVWFKETDLTENDKDKLSFLSIWGGVDSKTETLISFEMVSILPEEFYTTKLHFETTTWKKFKKYANE